MKVTHDCRVLTVHLPDDVTRVVKTERCLYCGMWWRVTHLDSSTSAVPSWLVLLPNWRKWVWRRQAKREIKRRRGE